MERVGAYLAKTHLAELLDRVARGESILITRNGKAAALLSPPPRGRVSTLDQTISELQAFGKKHTLGMDLRSAMEQGRR